MVGSGLTHVPEFLGGVRNSPSRLGRSCLGATFGGLCDRGRSRDPCFPLATEANILKYLVFSFGAETASRWQQAKNF